MTTAFDEHRKYVADAVRLRAYARALEETVKPGDVVLDLGSGTGILGFLACRAGAGKVYAVERGPLIGLAREIARKNGLDAKIVFVRGLSTRVDLPEKVDVLVADQIGNFGFEAGLLDYYADARARFLKPGGRAIPSSLDLFAAPVECGELWRDIEMWSRGPSGLDLSPARRWAESSPRFFSLGSEHLLGRAVRAASLDACVAGPLAVEASLETSRAGTLHGIGGWFEARLSPSVVVTNAPGSEGAIDRANAFFPLGEAFPVAAGARLRATWRYVDAEVFSWSVTSGEKTWTQSTLGSLLLGREALERTSPGFVPALAPRGEALLAALALVDGERTVAAIEDEIERRFPGAFRSRRDVAGFVAELVERHCR